MFDYLITNATVMDGSGGAAFVADIAVKDGMIATIGKVTGEAARVIDADDLVAAPGFIDMHSHTDSGSFRYLYCLLIRSPSLHRSQYFHL